MPRYCFPVLSIWILLTSGVLAQGLAGPPENKWEFSIFTGVSFLGDRTFVTPVEGGGTQDVDLNFDSSYLVGARITENLGDHFGADFEYTLANQPLSFVNLSPAVPVLDLEHKIHKLSYSVLFYPMDRKERVRPFGSIGLGASLFHISSDSQDEALLQGVDLKSRWKLAFSFGAGAKIQMQRNWGLRFDFRNQVTGVPSFGLPAQAPLENGGTGPGFRPSENFHNWQLGVALMYTFEPR